jgi:hypothetical protein
MSKLDELVEQFKKISMMNYKLRKFLDVLMSDLDDKNIKTSSYRDELKKIYESIDLKK